MPRLKKDDIEQREAFVLALFQEEPGLSAAKANEKVKAKFGSQMRAQRVYELRKKAGTSAVSQAGRKGKAAKKVPGRKPRVVEAAREVAAPIDFVPVVIPTGSAAESGVIQKALDYLRNAGALNLRVAHAAERYAVIDVA